MSEHKPLVAVCGCLLGEKIRYDGNSKENQVVLTTLSESFEFLSFCPEVEMGLGIPREPIQIQKRDTGLHLVSVKNPSIDHTELAGLTFKKMRDQMAKTCGVILTTKSPSCGLGSVEHFNQSGEAVSEQESGVWALFLESEFPELPKIDSASLENPKLLEEFILEVKKYSESRN